jgi:hypothetical protein
MATALADAQPTIEIDTVAFEAGMQRIRAGVRDGMIHPDYGTITVQARLLAERCQDFSPPRSKGQGEAAVKRDIMRLFYPLAAKDFKNPGIAKIVREDDRDAWETVSGRFPNGSLLKNTTAISVSPEFHQRNRNQRGKVGSANRPIMGYVTLGAEGVKAHKYADRIKKNVGWAKAGWNMGVIAFGGRVRDPWVARHSLARGKIVDGRSEPDPWVRVINDTGWAKSGVGQQEGNRIIRNAVDARARDMQKYAERMMQLAADGKAPSLALPAGM